MQRQAWVLMGPDLNKMLKAGYRSMLAEWTLQIRRKTEIYSQEIKEKKSTAIPNK